ncbi:MAG TPA: TIGR03560 family F420-dependent LLM class oxidoreductase [Chloroflexota bacterium]
MKVGLHVPVFAWEGGSEAMADHLANIAEAAEAAGFDQITVMDHYFALGPGEAYRRPMLEAYTALGFIAARTAKLRLGTLVTGVMYRYPGILIKQMTTLNVLSKGRAFFGIGAAWHEHEHHAFGVPFPPLKERFERLEETLQLAHQAWSGDSRPFRGKYYSLDEPYLSPEAVSKPRPRILVGGSGERKTLRLVATYADACHINASDLDAARHKLDVLRAHCADVGRDQSEIEKTCGVRMDVATDGSNVQEVIDRFAAAGEVGYDLVTTALPQVYTLEAIRLFGEKVIPALSSVGQRTGAGSTR